MRWVPRNPAPPVTTIRDSGWSRSPTAGEVTPRILWSGRGKSRKRGSWGRARIARTLEGSFENRSGRAEAARRRNRNLHPQSPHRLLRTEGRSPVRRLPPETGFGGAGAPRFAGGGGQGSRGEILRLGALAPRARRAPRAGRSLSLPPLHPPLADPLPRGRHGSRSDPRALRAIFSRRSGNLRPHHRGRGRAKGSHRSRGLGARPRGRHGDPGRPVPARADRAAWRLERVHTEIRGGRGAVPKTAVASLRVFSLRRRPEAAQEYRPVDRRVGAAAPLRAAPARALRPGVAARPSACSAGTPRGGLHVYSFLGSLARRQRAGAALLRGGALRAAILGRGFRPPAPGSHGLRHTRALLLGGRAQGNPRRRRRVPPAERARCVGREHDGAAAEQRAARSAHPARDRAVTRVHMGAHRRAHDGGVSRGPERWLTPSPRRRPSPFSFSSPLFPGRWRPCPSPWSSARR